MSVKVSDFKKIFPEFEDESSARLNFYLGMAERNVNRSIFGDKADDATYLLWAHFMTMANREGAAGAVSSEKVGDLSVNYSKGSSDQQEELAQTSYGTQFILLLKTLPTTPRVIGCL